MEQQVPFYQIDAFASAPFKGNQACIMPLEDGFLPDATLQAIAAENNVAETAYLVADGEGAWQLRWFTPAVEVPLCGHATLAAAHVLFDELAYAGEAITFRTRQSGDLIVRRGETGYVMDFPAPEVFPIEVGDEIASALGAQPIAAWGGPFYAAQFESPEAVRALKPDLRALATLGVSGIGGNWDRGNFGCFALGGEGVEVTSRFFAPGSGIDEDPATGSWHCMLTAIATGLLGQETISCYQAYPSRGAALTCTARGNRVDLCGAAVTVIRGTFTLPA